MIMEIIGLTSLQSAWHPNTFSLFFDFVPNQLKTDLLVHANSRCVAIGYYRVLLVSCWASLSNDTFKLVRPFGGAGCASRAFCAGDIVSTRHGCGHHVHGILYSFGAGGLAICFCQLPPPCPALRRGFLGISLVLGSLLSFACHEFHSCVAGLRALFPSLYKGHSSSAKMLMWFFISTWDRHVAVSIRGCIFELEFALNLVSTMVGKALVLQNRQKKM